LMQQVSQFGVGLKLSGIFRYQFFQRLAFQRQTIGKGHPVQQLRIQFPVDHVPNVWINFTSWKARLNMSIATLVSAMVEQSFSARPVEYDFTASLTVPWPSVRPSA
jgi:hypothetical protein